MLARTKFLSLCVLLVMGSPRAPAANHETEQSLPPVGDVIHKLLEMDEWRRMSLRGYRSQRRYVAANKRFHKRGEVAVWESYRYPGTKELAVVSESGSGFVRRRVIYRLIEAELDSVEDENRDQTRITPANYIFKMIGAEEKEGRRCFVIEVIPKTKKKYLMKGRIWVDQVDFAIVRMEGKPAKKPSFWTRRVHFVRRYKKHGPFWLTDSLQSESVLWIAGKSTLDINYFDYEINFPDPGHDKPGRSAEAGRESMPGSVAGAWDGSSAEKHAVPPAGRERRMQGAFSPALQSPTEGPVFEGAVR